MSKALCRAREWAADRLKRLGLVEAEDDAKNPSGRDDDLLAAASGLSKKRARGHPTTTKSKRARRGASMDDAKAKASQTGGISSRLILARVGEMDAHIPTEPANGFPDGWVIRRIPRKNSTKKQKKGNREDVYYYSPKLGLKFRSKPDVRRFLAEVEISGGDEEVAFYGAEGSGGTDKDMVRKSNAAKTSDDTNRGDTATRGERRNKRTESKPDSKPKPSRPHGHPTASEKDECFPTEPAEGFPNWVIRRIPRANKDARITEDKYYYSPKLGFKFRSKLEVIRFLAVMERVGGDEAKAIAKFGRRGH